MKNKILKIIILLAIILVLAMAGIFIYKQNSKLSLIFLTENNFDAIATVPNTDISFKYPSKGFYGLGVKFLGPNVEPDADMTEIKKIGFEYSAPIDKTKVSEYINFYLGPETERGNIDGEYNLENAVKAIKKIHGIIGIENGVYKTFNNYKFYIYKDDDQNDMEVWHAIFLQNDGAYQVSINYLKPKNTLYGNDSNTPESQAAYKNNDQLFLEILKNISWK